MFMDHTLKITSTTYIYACVFNIKQIYIYKIHLYETFAVCVHIQKGNALRNLLTHCKLMEFHMYFVLISIIDVSQMIFSYNIIIINMNKGDRRVGGINFIRMPIITIQSYMWLNTRHMSQFSI